MKQASKVEVERKEEDTKPDESSTISEVNAVMPAILDLSRETIYSGLVCSKEAEAEEE